MAVPMPMSGYGAMLAVPDVTERKQSEMALENSVRQFHSLYDNMAEGVALHSRWSMMILETCELHH